MAVNKTGIAQLFGVYDGGSSTFGGDSSNLSSEIIIARVIDVSLNTDSKLFNTAGQWSGLGTISFVELKSTPNTKLNTNSESLALPLFPNIKNYPLVNEVVIIIKGPGNTTPDISPTNKYFYISAAALWNSQHMNAYPSAINPQGNTSPSLDKDYKSMEGGNARRTTTEEQSIDLNGNSKGTFVEKSNIYPILSFAGDNIFEGRFGNSIRLGNTSKSNGNVKNNWSEGNNTENGDPITIIKNGQSDTITSPGYISITEDINVDPTSIYLTSTQKLPIDISVAQKNEGEESTIPYSNIIKATPKSPKSFNQPQIILNSGRLLFNTHTDNILFSSKKSIVLTSIEDLGIQSQTKNINLISDKGIISLGKQNASESVILGDSFITDFQALVDGLKTLCSALSKESSIPIASSLANIMSQADSVLDNISNRAKAGVYNSNKVKVS